MKTNVIMIRKMGNYDVSQRSIDGMFNATDLLRQWNKEVGMQKEVTKFIELEQTKEFIKVLEDEENLNTHKPAYISKRGKFGGTWMHPYLFIDFAMWINAKFKLQVIRFVYDELIKYRNSAGDLYIGLSGAVKHFDHVNYSIIGKALNHIVFGRHADNLRQNATELQLKELTQIEQQLAFSIDMGYIKSFPALINEMRRIWAKKYQSF